MAEAPSYEELLERLEKTERNAQISRDYVEISNLHGRYNHLCLGHYWDKIVDELFAQKTPGVKVEIVESGVFHGIEGARKVFVDMLGKLYTYEGNCAIHELTTPIIQVQKDMNTAKGMWYHVGFNTFLDPVKGVIPIWQVIKYNHIFVKEDGQWKFWDYRAHLLIPLYPTNLPASTSPTPDGMVTIRVFPCLRNMWTWTRFEAWLRNWAKGTFST